MLFGPGKLSCFPRFQNRNLGHPFVLRDEFSGQILRMQRPGEGPSLNFRVDVLVAAETSG